MKNNFSYIFTRIVFNIYFNKIDGDKKYRKK